MTYAEFYPAYQRLLDGFEKPEPAYARLYATYQSVASCTAQQFENAVKKLLAGGRFPSNRDLVNATTGGSGSVSGETKEQGVARLARLGEAVAFYSAWFNTTQTDARAANLSPSDQADYFDRAAAVYEQDRGRPMHPYFRRQLDYWLSRWRGLDAWPYRERTRNAPMAQVLADVVTFPDDADIPPPFDPTPEVA